MNYISEANVLHESRVQSGALPQLLQQRIHEELEACVLEAALAGLC